MQLIGLMVITEEGYDKFMSDIADKDPKAGKSVIISNEPSPRGEVRLKFFKKEPAENLAVYGLDMPKDAEAFLKSIEDGPLASYKGFIRLADAA